jgi:hypothetical protein
MSIWSFVGVAYYTFPKNASFNLNSARISATLGLMPRKAHGPSPHRDKIVTIRLTPAEAERAQRQAATAGRDLSKIVRALLAAWLAGDIAAPLVPGEGVRAPRRRRKPKTG